MTQYDHPWLHPRYVDIQRPVEHRAEGSIRNATSSIRKWLRRHTLSRSPSAKPLNEYPPERASLRPSPQYYGPCRISTLPNELLEQIFEYLMPQASIHHVCQRWNRVSDHFLIRHIDLGSGWSVPDRTTGLHSKLRRYPELCTQVRTINIRLKKPDQYDCRATARIISLCVALPTISFHADWDLSTWAIVREISKLTALKNLSLSGLHRPIPLEVVLDYLNQPSIRRLRLDRFRVREGQSSMKAYHPVEIAMCKLPERAGPHTSGAIELALINPGVTPETTESSEIDAQAYLCLILRKTIHTRHRPAHSRYPRSITDTYRP